jgi:hypothetical protein
LWIGENAIAASAAADAASTLDRGSERWFVALGVAIAASGKLARADTVATLVDDLEATPATDERSGRARAITRARASIQLAYAGEIARADALLAGCEDEPGAANDAGVSAWLHDAACERGTAAGEPVHPSVPRRARELSLQIGDRRAAFGQWSAETQLLSMIGALDESVEVVDGLAREAGAGSRTIAIYVRYVHARKAAAAGDLAPLLAFASSFPPSDNRRASSSAVAMAAQALLDADRLDEARDHAERVLATDGAAPTSTAAAHAVLARVHAARGDGIAALDASARADALASRGVFILYVALLHRARYEALVTAGRDEEAVAVLREAIANLDWRTRHLGEYRRGFFDQANVRALVSLAR